MSDEEPLPAPDTLFAWGIVYGARRQFRCAIPRDEQHDLAYAERRAAELGGVLVVLEVAGDGPRNWTPASKFDTG